MCYQKTIITFFEKKNKQPQVNYLRNLKKKKNNGINILVARPSGSSVID